MVLITPPEVIKKTGTNNNLDSGKLLPAIEIAELRFVQDPTVLGFDFYSQMATQKNQVVTAANQATLQAKFTAQPGNTVQLQVGDVVNAAEFLDANNRKLWDAVLWKYLAEAVHYMALTENYSEFSSSGIQKNNPIASAVASTTAESVGISLADLKYLKNSWLQERIEPLRMALMNWMYANGGNYPTWYATHGEPEKNSPYVDLSIYRDQGDCGCVYKGNNPGRHHNPGPNRCCDDGPANYNGW